MPFSFDEKYDCEIRVTITNNKITAKYYFLQYGKFINITLNNKHAFKDITYDSSKTSINELFPFAINSLVNDLINDELIDNVNINIETELDINAIIEEYMNNNKRTKYEKVNITLK